MTLAAEFGRPHLHLRLTDSTNDRARELAEAGAPRGTIVTAAAQSAGRGRHGRVWEAPERRALLLSAILTPLEAEHALLPLAAPLAVCEAIESLAPVDCRIKWPNDVWIEERKVAGVLIEARPPHWAVIGIGVNVSIEPHEFPDDLRWPATSVGHRASVEETRIAVCSALDRWVAAPRSMLLAEYRRRDALRGREISWEQGAGVAAGIDDDGELVVEAPGGGSVTLGSGEVSVRVSRA